MTKTAQNSKFLSLPFAKLTVLLVVLLGFLYAWPNLYGEAPAIQIIKNQAEASFSSEEILKIQQLAPQQKLTTDSITEPKLITLRFNNVAEQLNAQTKLQAALGADYSTALALLSNTPKWLQRFGAKPMQLGLDLRGGVRLALKISSPNQEEMQQVTLDKTLETLRKRVNELGISEAIVQSKGLDQITVELPGIQDSARAKKILGKTATLDFVLVAMDEMAELDLSQVADPKRPNKLKLRNPVLHRLVLDQRTQHWIPVKKRVILTGDAIINASSSWSQQDSQPIVEVRLNKTASKALETVTAKNIGKMMAVILKELRPDGSIDEKIISMATIQSVLGSNFQISGLALEQARDLALLLRSGALPANISIIEENVIGPSLGLENIRMGLTSMIVGLVTVLVVAIAYYRVLGVIAGLSLLANLVLLTALLSILGAALTLPGIAGIVLTLGMAVDANVLIFERIKEEFAKTKRLALAIELGFIHAWSTILDSNLTTLIVGVILYAIGTGPVKGFAVVLSLGILTSLFTAVTLGKVLVDLTPLSWLSSRQLASDKLA